MTDLIVTWPKSRPLSSYVEELGKAELAGLDINFRVPTEPREFLVGRRCYRVHSGHVRGWTKILGVAKRGPNQVARVESDAFAGFWPEGWYVVCSPAWYVLFGKKQIAVKGFQGYRYFDRSLLDKA